MTCSGKQTQIHLKQFVKLRLKFHWLTQMTLMPVQIRLTRTTVKLITVIASVPMSYHTTTSIHFKFHSPGRCGPFSPTRTWFRSRLGWLGFQLARIQMFLYLECVYKWAMNELDRYISYMNCIYKYNYSVELLIIKMCSCIN